MTSVDHVTTDETGAAAQHAEAWTRVPITRIEDLRDAVHGAGLEAVQMSHGLVSGSLAFFERNEILYSSGLVGGRVTLSGSLSETMVTLGLCLRISGRSWHWYKEVVTGTAGVFLPGDDHNALYASGSLYAAVTISEERLEEEAAREDLVLDRKALGGTGLLPRVVPLDTTSRIARSMECMHLKAEQGPQDRDIRTQLLRVLIAHNAREPKRVVGAWDKAAYGRIVARACSYIDENLGDPISVDAVAAAACTSRRTLYRAFGSVFDETPQAYTRRRRLHRIRQALTSDREAACTIALIANDWGIDQPGRLSGWYRELFGELPSETRAMHGRAHRKAAR